MEKFEKKLKNVDGSEEILVISSNDDDKVKCSRKMKLANSTTKKKNKITELFQKSILGSDIGINSAGFSNVAIMAVIITLFVAIVLYYSFRI